MGHPGAGLSLDRINNSEGYSKENCKWSTTSEQNRNKRNNRPVELNGKLATIVEHCEHIGLPTSAVGYIKYRIYSLKWSVEKAFDEANTINKVSLSRENIR